MTNKELRKFILQLIDKHEIEITEDEYDVFREVADRLRESEKDDIKYKKEEPSSSFDYLTDDPFKGAGW